MGKTTGKRRLVGTALVAITAMVATVLVTLPPVAVRAGNTPDRKKNEGIEAYLNDARALLTPTLLEALVVSLRRCGLKKFGVDFRCEAFKRYWKARRRKSFFKQYQSMRSTVGLKLIGHPSPTVRYMAVEYLRIAIARKPNILPAVLTTARQEQHPVVFAKMLGEVGSHIKTNVEVRRLLMGAADHSVAQVRKVALTALTSPSAVGFPGAFIKALEKVHKDPDITVRALVCARLYGTGQGRAITVMKKYVDDKKTNVRLYTGCFRGLINAWIGVPRAEAPSREAYLHTLKLLRKKPRDRDHPPWTIFFPLGRASEDTRSSQQRVWLNKVKGWYRARDLRTVLAEIILDSNVRWLGRCSAVRSYRALGATKKDLVKLRGGLGKGNNDRWVIKTLERALRK